MGVRGLVAVVLVTTFGLVGCAPQRAPMAGPPMPQMTPVAIPADAQAAAKAKGDCGCGSNFVLEAAVRAAQPKAAEALKASNGVLSDVRILAIPPDTIEYDFVFAEQQDFQTGQADAYFGTQAPNLQSTSDTGDFPAMKKIGIAHPKVRFTYINADGSIVWTRTFEPS